MNSSKYDTHQRTELVFRYIIRFKKQSGGCSPTLKEIARGTGIASVSTVTYHLDKLENSGRIIRDPSAKARYISIPGEVWYLPAVTPDGVPVV